MDKKKINSTGVAGIANLVGVWSEGRFYVGKVLQGEHLQLPCPSADFVVLTDAYWLSFPTRQLPTGQIEMQVLPMPIPPFNGPHDVLVRIGAFVDLSREEGLVDLHRAMTGSSGLVLPGMRL